MSKRAGYWVRLGALVTFLASCLNVAVAAAPQVVAVYPSGAAVPANLLRFYIRFSMPMQEMGILKHLRLQDDQGADVSGVFFENQYELWNRQRTEVTLLLDPGRVKMGLQAHEQLGWAFVPGRSYSLSIDRDLRNFKEQKLAHAYIHRFAATAADVSAPKPELWQLSLPRRGSRQALRIDFGKSLDHISAQSLIRVKHGDKDVAGRVTLAPGERGWRFTPQRAWAGGRYAIHLDKQLEDIAGNSIHQVFDHPVGAYKEIPRVVPLLFSL